MRHLTVPSRIIFGMLLLVLVMRYQRTGHSGLKLPAVSLGLWHNFGESTPHETKLAIARASGLPEGVTAPVARGFSIQERKKCTSSSRRRLFLVLAPLNVD